MIKDDTTSIAFGGQVQSHNHRYYKAAKPELLSCTQIEHTEHGYYIILDLCKTTLISVGE